MFEAGEPTKWLNESDRGVRGEKTRFDFACSHFSHNSSLDFNLSKASELRVGKRRDSQRSRETVSNAHSSMETRIPCSVIGIEIFYP